MAALLLSVAATAAPRPPLPPWPEGGVLHRESFDQLWPSALGQWIDPAVWAESWSGYALNRASGQPVVAPWVVPMLATNGNWSIDPQRGALRLWYQPDGGSGGRKVATLLTLVSSAPKSGTAVWWSLVVSADGQSVLLTCESAGGPSICLGAPVAFKSGAWYLLTLAYTETNSTLFLDDQEVTTGYGLPTVPAEVAPFTSLVIGSRLSGDQVACGQFEEFTALTTRRRYRHEPVFDPRCDVGEYYPAYSGQAALGVVTEAEVAAERAARQAARQKALLAAAMDTSGGYGPLDGGGCVTGGPVYITNAVCTLDTYTGWTVAFDIAGGTNGIAYDIFRTPSLRVDSVTNWPWVFLGQGYTCNSCTLTNQPEAAAFYLLGDSTVDPDDDGLGTAFEWLISHSDPTNKLTRGDDIDDRTAYLQGRNPRVPGSVPDTNGVLNLQVFTPLR